MFFLYKNFALWARSSSREYGICCKDKIRSTKHDPILKFGETISNDQKINFKNKSYVQSLKKKAIKPEYFPAIRTCRAANGKIYVITYLKKNKDSECFIFNLEGKQLKRTFIPLRDTSPLNTPMFGIYNHHLYQLVENFDKEQWQLVIDPIY